MVEDKLTPAQRIRLEAVAQANARLGPPDAVMRAGARAYDATHDGPADRGRVLLTLARQIETYIRDGDE